MRDEAYMKLREWIITGKFEQGAKLRDQDLSEMLGISRTPIREALLMLENEGFVETKANRWTIVSYIDMSKAKNFYEIVAALEGLAIELSLHRLLPQDIEKLEQLNDQFNTLMNIGNQLAAWEIDQKFHEMIIQASDNEELQKMLAGLKVKIKRVEMHYFSQLEFMKTSYFEHLQIIDAIKKRDVNQAAAAIKANWLKSWDRLQRNEA